MASSVARHRVGRRRGADRTQVGPHRLERGGADARHVEKRLEARERRRARGGGRRSAAPSPARCPGSWASSTAPAVLTFTVKRPAAAGGGVVVTTSRPESPPCDDIATQPWRPGRRGEGRRSPAGSAAAGRSCRAGDGGTAARRTNPIPDRIRDRDGPAPVSPAGTMTDRESPLLDSARGPGFRQSPGTTHLADHVAASRPARGSPRISGTSATGRAWRSSTPTPRSRARRGRPQAGRDRRAAGRRPSSPRRPTRASRGGRSWPTAPPWCAGRWSPRSRGRRAAC